MSFTNFLVLMWFISVHVHRLHETDDLPCMSTWDTPAFSLFSLITTEMLVLMELVVLLLIGSQS